MAVFKLIGGKRKVISTVNLLAELISKDPEGCPVFSSLPQQKMRETLYVMLIHLLSGEYSRRSREAFRFAKELGFSPGEGRSLARHLRSTLREMGMAEDDIRETLQMADQRFLESD